MWSKYIVSSMIRIILAFSNISLYFQVAFRISCSCSPVLFWFAAYLVTPEDGTRQLSNADEISPVSISVTSFFVMYSIIWTADFSSFKGFT